MTYALTAALPIDLPSKFCCDLHQSWPIVAKDFLIRIGVIQTARRMGAGQIEGTWDTLTSAECLYDRFATSLCDHKRPTIMAGDHEEFSASRPGHRHTP